MAGQRYRSSIAAILPGHGDNAQHRQTQQFLQFFGPLESVVKALEQEGQTNPAQQTQHQRQQRIQLQLGLVGQHWRLGFIHHRDIVGADASSHADFLETLQ